METQQTTGTPYPNIPPLLKVTTESIVTAVCLVRLRGHPLHPLSIIFPIALLAAALGSDFGYWLTRDPSGEHPLASGAIGWWRSGSPDRHERL